MQGKLDKISNHLEFLGYEIERRKAEKGNDFLLAKHSRRNNIVVVDHSEWLTFFRIALNTTKDYSKEISDYVNEMNSTLTVSRVFFEKDNESSKVVIIFNAMYIGDYTKEIFGNFLDTLTSDTEVLFQSGESFEKIFLDQ
jgi:hypothetical protein